MRLPAVIHYRNIMMSFLETGRKSIGGSEINNVVIMQGATVRVMIVSCGAQAVVRPGAPTEQEEGMLELTQLLPQHSSQAAAFLSRFPEETLELTGRFEKYGLKNTRLHKKEGDWYGVFRDETLTGIFQFSNHHSLLCHYTDAEILRKVVLLKTIRQYKPRNLSGVRQCVDPIYQLLSKSVKDVRYAECWQMFAPAEEPVSAPAVPRQGGIMDARQYDLNRAMDFLIEAEKAFGRKPRMNSDLKVRILDREEQETYLFLLDNGNVVAQGMIEYHTARYAQISAVYTAKALRGKGYGTVLMQELMSRIRRMGLQPALIVENRNTAALSLYEKLGFVKGPASVVINIEME